MELVDSAPKAQRRKTPNWAQVWVLLLGGILLVVGGCGGAYLVFGAAYFGDSKTLLVLWWIFMGVCCIGLLMLIAGVLFMLFIALRTVGRATRGGTAGVGR